MDYRRVEEAKEANLSVIFGDASQEVVLEAAHVDNARLILVTTPAVQTTRAIVAQARRLNPERSFRFAAGDTVAVMGSAEQIAAFQALSTVN